MQEKYPSPQETLKLFHRFYQTVSPFFIKAIYYATIPGNMILYTDTVKIRCINWDAV